MGQPTMQQVAERAGVSTALVSLVMRGAPNVSDYRRELVRAAAEELGYRPNVLARNLASRRTRTIGVVLNDLHNPFFAEIVDGVQDAADDAEYRILIGNGKHSKSGEAESVETFLEFRVDGLILVGPTASISSLEKSAAATPVVMVGRTTRSRSLDTVNTNDELGARLAIDHLIEIGHRNIAHIDGGSGAGAAARRRGYRQAMTDHDFTEFIDVVGGDFSEAGGRTAAAQLLDRAVPPTAIFAANDLTAVGALDAVEDVRVRVPDELSIIGYDNTALAAMHHVALTTINQPRHDLGTTAVELLLQRLDEGRTDVVHHVLAPTLVARSTTSIAPMLSGRVR